MSRLTLAIAATLTAVLFATCVSPATWAQGPAYVTTYYPPQPVVGYVPQPAGLLGLRTAYRPVVSYVTPTVTTVARPVVVAPAPTVAYLAPVAPAPVTAYYAPAPASVTAYYAPAPAAVAAPSAPGCSCSN
jgi:hypothetical protein